MVQLEECMDRQTITEVFDEQKIELNKRLEIKTEE